jgi:hypothetical protein
MQAVVDLERFSDHSSAQSDFAFVGQSAMQYRRMYFRFKGPLSFAKRRIAK